MIHTPHTPSIRPVHGGNLAWAAAIAGCSPDSLLDVSASINPLGPPESVTVAMATALGQLGHYPDPDYTSLRQTLGAYHGLPADWVLPGNGAAELLTWAARDLAEGAAPRGCHLLTPAFADYGRALDSFGVPHRAWPLSISATEIRPPQPWPEPEAAGVLINNPHNPTGHLFSVASLEPLLERFATVIVDEAFMDFLPPDQQP
ncbi:MAG TPA: aminotransferase class I/II-fold pyridoxal phosphate-dependent enzyme, partial [Nodosilinea sp.]|nr:aminotransferase class I/II-fold pyridoxal phosphate-dependent enzyme [Nodosilinea sp.]